MGWQSISSASVCSAGSLRLALCVRAQSSQLSQHWAYKTCICSKTFLFFSLQYFLIILITFCHKDISNSGLTQSTKKFTICLQKCLDDICRKYSQLNPWTVINTISPIITRFCVTFLAQGWCISFKFRAVSFTCQCKTKKLLFSLQ